MKTQINIINLAGIPSEYLKPLSLEKIKEKYKKSKEKYSKPTSLKLIIAEPNYL